MAAPFGGYFVNRGSPRLNRGSARYSRTLTAVPAFRSSNQKTFSLRVLPTGAFLRDTARMAQQNERTDSLAVSIQRAAEMLDLSRRTIENFIAADQIPARKVRRRTLILVCDLEAFLHKDQPSPRRMRRAVAQKGEGRLVH